MTRRTVLVVDDEPDIRELVRLGLEHFAGWRVLVASGGAEAISLTVAERPEAVLLDVMMPGMDGPETARRLGDDPRTTDVPVVLLTARPLTLDEVHASGTPAAGVLAKPFDVATLGAQVSTMLGWAA